MRILACEFLHVGTVLVLAHLCLVRDGDPDPAVHIAGVTIYPTGGSTAQQARNLLIALGERAGRFTFLIRVRDRDSKVTMAFDGVFAGNGTRVIKAPVRSSAIMATMLGRACQQGPDGR